MRSALFVLVGACAIAATNEVTINSAAGESDRPITISRVFVEGELADYPRPSISGAPLAEWQANVMTRYMDGSVRHALISFVATLGAGNTVVAFVNDTEPCHLGNQATCDADGYTEAEILAHNSSNWGASIEATADSVTKSANARTMVDAAHFSKWIEGPIVDIVLVEDLSSSLTYNFGWQWDGTDMIDTSDAQYQSITPRFILTMYHSYAGVKIDYVLENTFIGKRQDQYIALALKKGSALGATVFSTPNNTYVGTSSMSSGGGVTTVNTASAHGLTTGNIVSINDGSAGGGSVARGNWPVTVVDSDTFTIPTSSTSASLTVRPFNLGSFTRIRKTFWDGSEPGAIRVDYNLDYMIESRAVPNYDRTYDKPMTGALTAFNATDRGEIGGKAQEQKSWGGQEESVPVQQIPLMCLSNMTSDDYPKILFGTEVVGGGGHFASNLSVPVHYREDGTGFFRDADGNGTAETGERMGKILSIDARTSARTSNDTGIPSIVGGSATKNGWVVDSAHAHNESYTAYLLTGDPIFAEELAFWASWNVAFGNPGTTINNRHGVWGLVPSSSTREIGVGFKFLSQAAAMLPDAQMADEKAYFTQKLNNNIAVREGVHDIRTTANYPSGGVGSTCTVNSTGDGCDSGTYNGATETSKWVWGRMTQAQGEVGSTKLNPLMFLQPGVYDPPTTTYVESTHRGDDPWHEYMVEVHWGHAKELGFAMEPILSAVSTNLIQRLLHSDYNKWLVDIEEAGMCLGANYTAPTACTVLMNWADAKAAIVAAHRDKTSWTSCSTDPFSKCFRARSAMSFFKPYSGAGFTGEDAWAELDTMVNVASRSPTSNVFIIEPRALSSSETRSSVSGSAALGGNASLQ